MADLTRELLQVPFQCGKCFHFQPVEIRGPVTIGQDKPKGICFGAPPSVRWVIDKHTGIVTGQANIRPIVNIDERACGAFIPLETAPGAANDLNG